MDNEIFRKTYKEVNERFCPYEKSILTNQARCSQAERFCIAEREGVHCKSDAAQQQCLDLLGLLRQQARFALKSNDSRSALPHAKAMRVQVGGLRGIHRFLHPEDPVPEPIPDIFVVIQAAREQAQGLERLPFQEIIKAMAAYQGRPRSSKRRR